MFIKGKSTGFFKVFFRKKLNFFSPHKKSKYFQIILNVVISASLLFSVNYLLGNIFLKDKVQSLRFFSAPDIGDLFVRLTTDDAFMANNSIVVELTTANLIPSLRIKNINVHFQDARLPECLPGMEKRYFTIPYLYRNNIAEWIQRKNSSGKKCNKSSLLLTEYNQLLMDMYVFSGKIEDLIYYYGGSFDIIINYEVAKDYERLEEKYGDTVHDSSYSVGYEEKSITIEDVIRVAPSETILNVKNNNIILGLTWLMATIGVWQVRSSTCRNRKS